MNAKWVEGFVHAVLALGVTAAPAFAAGTFTVTNANDAGPGSLRQAILVANAAGGGTINVSAGGLLTLASPLPIITASTTLNGNNLVVSGNNQNRVFFVDAPAGAAVAFNNLAITNGRATGGAGGLGGGGGLGAGGAIFVNSGSVTLTNINFSLNAAVGGKGGDGASNNAYGGGGGLGGKGGDAAGGGGGYRGDGGSTAGGGGGFDTPGANGGFNPTTGGAGGGQGGVGPAFGGGSPSTQNTGAGGGGGSLNAPGGNAAGNVGGNGGRFGGGGAGGGPFATAGTGGNGGEFGGGAGSAGHGGNGGFGGGGGSGGANSSGAVTGGNGGFGGGGGGSRATGGGGAAGAFAGRGISFGSPFSDLGGGGAALGGHVFVRAGASLALVDVGTDGGTVTPGQGGEAPPFADPHSTAPAGQSAGSAFFLAGPTTFTVSGGQTRTIAGSIGDVAFNYGRPTTTGFLPAKVTKSGTGTLVLSAPFNEYIGGTLISQGTLQAAGGPSLAYEDAHVVINDAATGAADTTFVLAGGSAAQPIDVVNAGSGVTTIASPQGPTVPTAFAGAVTLGRSVTVSAQNNATLPANHDGGQTRFDGAISGPGGVTIAGGNMVQFRTGAKTYAGLTRVTANSTLSLWDSTSTPSNSTVQVDAGSTLVIENVQGLFPAVLGGLAGSGTVAQNPAYFRADLNVGNDNADAAFTGTVTGRLGVNKVGAGTQSWGAQDNAALSLNVTSGRLRLTGNQHVNALSVPKADAGTQALDLNGKTVDIETFGSFLSNTEFDLDHSMGSAIDGIYDSTATSGQAVGLTWQNGSTHVLMRLTRGGDANLDRVVNFSDLVALAQNYNKSGALTWDQGDFNYDDAINFSDLVILAQNYNRAFAADAVPGAPAGFSDDVAAAFAASVPEPSSVIALAAAGATVARRRARRSLQS